MASTLHFGGSSRRLLKTLLTLGVTLSAMSATALADYQVSMSARAYCPECERELLDPTSSTSLRHLPTLGTSTRTFHDYRLKSQVRKMMQIANREARVKTRHNCYHALKSILARAHLIKPGSLRGNSAYMAALELKSQGFVNLLKDPRYREKYAYLAQHPESAPMGSILVFSGGKHGFGDVQIRTSRGFVADYASTRPITKQWNGKLYRLIGVMVKPDAE